MHDNEKNITILPKKEPLTDNQLKILFSKDKLEINFFEFWVKESRKSEKKIKLQTYRYQKTDNPKGAVIHFHGFTSSNTFNGFWAENVADCDLVYLSFDLRGHGKSEGKNTHFDHLNQLLDDSRIFIQEMRKLYPIIPFFIGGLSLGGLISLHLSHESPMDFIGVYFFAPAIRTSIPKFLQKILYLIGYFFPNSKLPNRDNLHKICRSKFAIETYKNSENFKRKSLDFKTIRALLKGVDESEKIFEKYENDFIMIMGGKDFLIKPEVAFDFINKSPSKDKHLYYYEGCFHDIIGDDDFFDVSVKMKAFFSRKLNSKF